MLKIELLLKNALNTAYALGKEEGLRRLGLKGKGKASRDLSDIYSTE